MPSRAVHSRVGAVAGAAAAFAAANAESDGDRLVEALGGMLGGYVGGLLPDGIDAPTTPNHRSVGHGGLAVTILAKATWAAFAEQLRARSVACVVASADPALPQETRNALQFQATLYRLAAGFVLGFPAGYASHLALDLFTPRSLPLIG